MNKQWMARSAIALAITGVCAGSAWAGLPSAVKTAHPRLYGSSSDFDRLRMDAAVGPVAFPASKGELRFTISAVPTGPGDPGYRVIFGNPAIPNSIYLQHADGGASSGRTRLYIAMQRDTKTGTTAAVNAFATAFEVPIGKATEIVLAYDAAAKTAKLTVGGVVHPAVWTSAGDGWSAANQRFVFNANIGDVFTNVAVTDNAQAGSPKLVWKSRQDEAIDIVLNRAWNAYLERAERVVGRLANCPATVPVTDTTECNTVRGGRGGITEPAKWLSLAYRFTQREEFLIAARKHIDLLLKADVFAGEDNSPEWSMGGRVGAMGIYFDWLYAELGRPTRDQLATQIKATIAYDVAGTSGDLVNSICGYQKLSTSAYDCATKPATTWTGNGNYSIADTYLSGHSASANASAALGLLAIFDEHTEVRPLLDTIYDHFAKGYLPARDFYSSNGGSHTLFAYAASGGETMDRLVMWRRALETPVAPEQGLQLASGPQMIYPYMYGVRSDGAFPARGDDFLFSTSATGVGSAALAAVAANGDEHAAQFYWKYVQPKRTADSLTQATLDERLLYPKPSLDTPVSQLPLSRHFTVAGNVLMRDTWDAVDATLLEFKSTSFISVNHHHMDQNSFSLYYKAPLLLDSGKYDKYGSNHWHNYYIRSIAHNTVTVYDSTEVFDLGGTAKGLSVDGGQWLGTRSVNPRSDEIAANGASALVGVTDFEEGGDYSYVAGNASKAYVNGKIDSTVGFLRSIVYLRPSNSTEAPKVLVFDSVRPTKDGLEITSLLHSVNKPTSTIVPSPVEGGRYRFDFGGATQPLTIRNGDGMVTVQTLLPADPAIVISGGVGEGSTCTQAPDTFYTKLVQDTSDCRFLVRSRGADGIKWRNFAVLEKADNVPMETTRSTDIGAWRVEISPKAAPAKGTTHYFLNVLHVADSDKRLDGAAGIDGATLLSNESNTVAVALKNGQTFVFNGGPQRASSLTWNPGTDAKAPTLVVGLERTAKYSLTPVSTAQGTRLTLKRDEAGTYTSSANGTLRLNP